MVSFETSSENDIKYRSSQQIFPDGTTIAKVTTFTLLFGRKLSTAGSSVEDNLRSVVGWQMAILWEMTILPFLESCGILICHCKYFTHLSRK